MPHVATVAKLVRTALRAVSSALICHVLYRDFDYGGYLLLTKNIPDIHVIRSTPRRL